MSDSEDNSEPDLLKATGDQFFQCIEKQLKTSLPQYVIKILKMNGFDNAFMMSKLVESKISEIEGFMRNEFASFMLPVGENVHGYLGVYKQCQEKFKFLCGHKTLLEIMRDTCKVYYPPITKTKAVNDSAIEDIYENSKNEIFQKLFDGVTQWLNSHGILPERECSSTKAMSSKPTSVESVISCGTTSDITEALTCQSLDHGIDYVPSLRADAPIISENRLRDSLSKQVSDLKLGVKLKVSWRKIRDVPAKSSKSGSSVPGKRLRM